MSSTLRYEFALAYCHALCGHRHDPVLGARLDMIVTYTQQQPYALREMPMVHVEIEPREVRLEPVKVHPMEVAQYITSLHEANAALTSEVQALRQAVANSAAALNRLLPPHLQLTPKPA